MMVPTRVLAALGFAALTAALALAVIPWVFLVLGDGVGPMLIGAALCSFAAYQAVRRLLTGPVRRRASIVIGGALAVSSALAAHADGAGPIVSLTIGTATAGLAVLACGLARSARARSIS